jgi:caa(3)-type oxidase subunit IV
MAHSKPHDPNAPGHPSVAAPQNGTELDVYPAGAADSHHHHGHTIVPPSTLLAVLMALLALTVLTWGASQVETFVATMFNVVLPDWVNVFVALSIAVIKTTLVVMFFMQLRYDNPLNTMVFLFTMVTVLFFLGFTMIDLGTRGTVDRFKAAYVVDGGTGGIVLPSGSAVGANTPITVHARREAENPESPKHQYLHHAEEHAAPVAAVPPARDISQGFPVGPYAPEQSSPQKSRPVRGLTLPGLAPAAAGGDHGHNHH